ncbi:hypothetical protein OAL03_03535 [Akkermansiaceae bacterium]|nr:hypothetical protein [Akkermansiaceae bacterium]
MSDFFEKFSDRIEDDAGGFAAMGGLAALSNQRASLKKLSGIQEQLEKSQAASAKTEKERLAIEKQRLKLQQAQIEEQKFTAESVKELRILMADADTLFERMSRMAAAPSGGGDTYDLDLTRTAALIQVKLELVEKNSEVLSDLADLKEQRRLKSHFEKQLSESATLRHLPENPLSFVEDEVFDRLQDIWSVFVPVEELSNEGALKVRGLDIASMGYLISQEKLVNLKERLTKALERLDQLKIQLGVTVRFTNNQFEETKILFGQFYFLKGKKPDFDFLEAFNYLKKIIEEPEFKSQMEGEGAQALGFIEGHITCARDQGVTLRDAAHRISLGDFELARSVEQIPKAERYANHLFTINTSKLLELNKYSDCFLPSIDLSAVDLDSFPRRIQNAWDVLGVETWADDSELKQRISKNKNIIREITSKRARKKIIVITVASCIIVGGFFSWLVIEGKKSKAAQQVEWETAQEKKKAAETAQEKKKALREAERKARISALEPIRNSLSLKTLLGEAGGGVVAWGYDSEKQCKVPNGLTDVVGIAAGYAHSLALKKDGTVVAWGDNLNKQCDVPFSLTDVVAISAGKSHSLALKNDGTVVAWGENSDKQCVVPASLWDVVKISAGSISSLALKKDGTVVAWGNNGSRQFKVPNGLTDVVEIAAGIGHSLVLKNDGTVVAWGDDSSKQCEVPNGLTDVVGISAGKYHSLALKKDGRVVAWGSNSYKQCDVPSSLTDVVGIAAGIVHSLALKNDGTVVAWGSNSSDQLNVPGGLIDVVGIFSGSSHNLVIKKISSD